MTTSSFAQLLRIRVDASRSYQILNEDKIRNTLLGDPINDDTVRANLILKGDTSSLIFTQSKLKNDSLKIWIYRTDPMVHNECLITIVKDNYSIAFKHLTSGVQIDRKISPVDSKVLLNGLDFKKGNIIRGYLQLRAKCERGCPKKWIIVKGNFKIRI